MKSEKMVDFSYRCKCGARVTGKAERGFTPAEIEELKRRGCGVCYLKNLLEKDSETVGRDIK